MSERKAKVKAKPVKGFPITLNDLKNLTKQALKLDEHESHDCLLLGKVFTLATAHECLFCPMCGLQL